MSEEDGVGNLKRQARFRGGANVPENFTFSIALLSVGRLKLSHRGWLRARREDKKAELCSQFICVLLASYLVSLAQAVHGENSIT